jgi:hypothetical protein
MGDGWGSADQHCIQRPHLSATKSSRRSAPAPAVSGQRLPLAIPVSERVERAESQRHITAGGPFFPYPIDLSVLAEAVRRLLTSGGQRFAVQLVHPTSLPANDSYWDLQFSGPATDRGQERIGADHTSAVTANYALSFAARRGYSSAFEHRVEIKLRGEPGRFIRSLPLGSHSALLFGPQPV